MKKTLRASLASVLLGAAMLLLLASCAGPPPSPPVQTVFDHLPAGLFSVWGTSARDVWTVGSDPGDGPFVLHYDGSAWRRMATGQHGGLWWVHGWDRGPVMMGGDGGLIVRYDAGAFTRMTTPLSSRTVFGIWGASASDVLAVGGVADSAGFVWHYDGTSWSNVPLPTGYPGGAVFKVWGNAIDDAWLVGARGALMHWNGSALTMSAPLTSVTLFTVHSIAGLSVAVGGEGNAVMLERAGSADWHDVTPPTAPTMIGVWVTPTDGWAVGAGGQWLRRQGGRWQFDDTGPNLAGRALHSVWVDPEGGVWAAGGDILSFPVGDGTLQHRGASVAGGTFTP